MDGLTVLTAESFACICFIILMQNGRGLDDKAPDYIETKRQMLADGFDAIGKLDMVNRQRLMEWMVDWNVTVPEEYQTTEWWQG